MFVLILGGRGGRQLFSHGVPRFLRALLSVRPVGVVVSSASFFYPEVFLKESAVEK